MHRKPREKAASQGPRPPLPPPRQARKRRWLCLKETTGSPRQAADREKPGSSTGPAMPARLGRGQGPDGKELSAALWWPGQQEGAVGRGALWHGGAQRGPAAAGLKPSTRTGAAPPKGCTTCPLTLTYLSKYAWKTMSHSADKMKVLSYERVKKTQRKEPHFKGQLHSLPFISFANHFYITQDFTALSP